MMPPPKEAREYFDRGHRQYFTGYISGKDIVVQHSSHQQADIGASRLNGVDHEVWLRYIQGWTGNRIPDVLP